MDLCNELDMMLTEAWSWTEYSTYPHAHSDLCFSAKVYIFITSYSSLCQVHLCIILLMGRSVWCFNYKSYLIIYSITVKLCLPFCVKISRPLDFLFKSNIWPKDIQVQNYCLLLLGEFLALYFQSIHPVLFFQCQSTFLLKYFLLVIIALMNQSH